MDKQRIIDEIRRVAHGALQLSSSEFKAKGTIGLTTVRYHFGSWNKAVIAAGLQPIRSGNRNYNYRQSRPDSIYLLEIIRITKKLGKRPTEAEFSAEQIYSVTPYRDRWGSFAKACEVAYSEYGFPTKELSAQFESGREVIEGSP